MSKNTIRLSKVLEDFPVPQYTDQFYKDFRQEIADARIRAILASNLVELPKEFKRQGAQDTAETYKKRVKEHMILIDDYFLEWLEIKKQEAQNWLMEKIPRKDSYTIEELEKYPELWDELVVKTQNVILSRKNSQHKRWSGAKKDQDDIGEPDETDETEAPEASGQEANSADPVQAQGAEGSAQSKPNRRRAAPAVAEKPATPRKARTKSSS